MRRFARGSAPGFLSSKWRAWGIRFKNNRTKSPAFKFQWPAHQGAKVNSLLEPFLKVQTDDHCSYCDNFPVRSKEDSIDHFKNKANPAHYELVCQWENLYYCCQNCQQSKQEQYSTLLLRPDDIEYSFEKYFIYSYHSHKIEPSPVLSDMNLERAIKTIDIFGFNDAGHVAARRISLERYEGKRILNDDINISDFPYRFIILA